MSNFSEKSYRRLFEHFPICIIVVDVKETPPTIIEVNRRAELIFGNTAAELIGMPIAQLIPEAAQSTILNIAQRAQQSEIATIETISQHRDGTHFPVRMIAAIDPTVASYIIITVEDITSDVQRRSEAEAIASERQRIAHEIHDGVAQTLAGLRFKSAMWHHLAEQDPLSIHAALDEVQTVLKSAIVDLRRAIFALRPVDLESLGFFPALAQMISDIGDQNQMVALLEVSGTKSNLPAMYELPLFRIIQEGLNNIVQHAGASSILVSIWVDAFGGVKVTISDNGCGFDREQLTQVDRDGHFGLRQMRERVLDLGGTLDIKSAFGQGTELVVSLPPISQRVNHVPN